MEMTVQLTQLNLGKKGDRSQRQLFRKVEKAFDKKDMAMAMLQAKCEAIEARLWDLEHKKRKKVELTPNSKFANIQAVRRSRHRDPDFEDSFSELSDVESVDSTLSCIYVD
ncbi:hypothetical protein V8F06_012836 [Rhypophila decipiens]